MTGIDTLKTVPYPTSDLQSIEPFKESTIFLQIVRPNPTPYWLILSLNLSL